MVMPMVASGMARQSRALIYAARRMIGEPTIESFLPRSCLSEPTMAGPTSFTSSLAFLRPASAERSRSSRRWWEVHVHVQVGGTQVDC